jgi:hypothetical protein
MDKGNQPGSLPGLKGIGCKSARPVHIFALSWSMERLLTGKIVKGGTQAFRRKAKVALQR